MISFKKLILIPLILVHVQNCFALSVVSDLDDTLKITNVQNIISAARNALFSKKAFKGMPSLLHEMSSYSTDLFIVTGSPKFLNRPVKKFLRYNKINPKKVFMKNLTGNSEAFKLKSLRRIIQLTSDEELILIGDNTQADAKVYLKIQRDFPSKVSRIYIRVIKRLKASFQSVSPFYTSYDIALEEFKVGRMTEEQVSHIGNQLISERYLSSYIPSFAYCPTHVNDFAQIEVNALTELTARVRMRIIKFCNAR